MTPREFGIKGPERDSSAMGAMMVGGAAASAAGAERGLSLKQLKVILFLRCKLLLV